VRLARSPQSGLAVDGASGLGDLLAERMSVAMKKSSLVAKQGSPLVAR
jgi:hypothetical protein